MPATPSNRFVELTAWRCEGQIVVPVFKSMLTPSDI
jgi:hypothetical protein